MFLVKLAPYIIIHAEAPTSISTSYALQLLYQYALHNLPNLTPHLRYNVVDDQPLSLAFLPSQVQHYLIVHGRKTLNEEIF